MKRNDILKKAPGWGMARSTLCKALVPVILTISLLLFQVSTARFARAQEFDQAKVDQLISDVQSGKYKALYNPTALFFAHANYHVGKPTNVALHKVDDVVLGAILGAKKGAATGTPHGAMAGAIAKVAMDISKDAAMLLLRDYLENPQAVARGLANEAMRSGLRAYRKNHALASKMKGGTQLTAEEKGSSNGHDDRRLLSNVSQAVIREAGEDFEAQYEAGNKWLAFFGAGLFDVIDVAVYVDLADYMGVTPEGKGTGKNNGERWVTVWFDGGAGAEVSLLPVSFGVSKLSFDTREPDPRRLYGVSLGKASLPGFSVTSVQRGDGDGQPQWGSTELGSIGVSATLFNITANLARFEIKKSVLDSIVEEAFSGLSGRIDAAYLAMKADKVVTSIVRRDKSTGGVRVVASGVRRFTSSDEGPISDDRYVDAAFTQVHGVGDRNGDGFGNLTYPVVRSIGNMPMEGYDTFVEFQNIGNNTSDFFVMVDGAPKGWLIYARDGGNRLMDRKFDVASIRPGDTGLTKWGIGATPDAPSTARVRFRLYHDGILPVSAPWLGNKYLDEVEVTLKKQDVQEQPVIKSGPGRLLVLLDRSGSMKGSDPKGLAMESLRLLATIAGAEAEIGVIAFSDQARWVVSPAPAGLPGSPTRRAMREAAARLAPGGGTDISAALALAATEADGHSRLILLGDGEDKGWSGGPGLLPAGARVDTIAFTDRAGVPALQALSTATGGRFVLAQDADAMRRALSAQMFDAQAAPLLLDLMGRVNAGQMLAHQLTVDPETAALSVAVEWPGSDLDLVAVAPDGRRHAARDGGLVSGTVEALRIARPVPGQWQIEVTGIDTAADGSVFSLRAAAEGGLVPLSLDAGAEDWQAGRPLALYLRSTPQLAWHTAVVTWRNAGGRDLATATVRVQPDGGFSPPPPPDAGPLRLEVSATATTATGNLVRQAAVERSVAAAPDAPGVPPAGRQGGWFAVTGD